MLKEKNGQQWKYSSEMKIKVKIFWDEGKLTEFVTTRPIPKEWLKEVLETGEKRKREKSLNNWKKNKQQQKNFKYG